MLVVEFSMTPIGKGESVSKYVARAVDIVDRSGLDYVLGPMGTCVEGEWDDVFAVVRKCYFAMAKDCSRVSIAIKVDARRGRKGALAAKVQAVEKKIGRRIRRI